jgi:hypothetical protein
MSMNLKTHTGYPESHIAEDFSWVARILGLHGDVLEEFKGKAKSRDDARTATKAALDPVKDKYLRKEG